MPEKTQLFIGLRRKNGQIGYLSESLNIPEFFDLIHPNKEGKNSLTDFSPIIEKLHSIHEKSIEHSIREKYNSVFNYWQESKSYSSIQIRLPKLESLSLLSNELINSLQFRIESSKSRYSHRRTTDPQKNLEAIKEIQQDSNAYIDTLLCFIHSKASLEIESFQNDVVLSQYCDFLKNTTSSLFNSVVEYSTFRDDFELHDSSLLYHLAFENNPEIDYYTRLLPNFDHEQDLRITLTRKGQKEGSRNYSNEEYTRIGVEYRNPHHQEIESAKILRDILYKISSISELLKRLKEGGIDWDPSKDSIEELRKLTQPNKPGS